MQINKKILERDRKIKKRTMLEKSNREGKKKGMRYSACAKMLLIIRCNTYTSEVFSLEYEMNDLKIAN